MAINKVIYGNDTLIDLTSDTVSANNLLAGETAHDRSGTAIQGIVMVPDDLNDLSDVDISSPTDGQALLYDNTVSKWINGNIQLTESQVTNLVTDLSNKIGKFKLTNERLSDVTTEGFYYAETNNTCNDKPSGIPSGEAFGLLVVKVDASNIYQIYFRSQMFNYVGQMYKRTGSASIIFGYPWTLMNFNNNSRPINVNGTELLSNSDFTVVNLKNGSNVSISGSGSDITISSSDNSKVGWASNGILGAKNFNSYPYYDTTKTISNLVYTDNGDGTITANGSNNTQSNANFNFHQRNQTLKNLILPNGKYILTGCPSDGNNTYYIRLETTISGVRTVLGFDYGDGVEVELTGDDYAPTGFTQIGLVAVVTANVTVNNIIFKPMIRLAEDIDDTWQPYAQTNKELANYVLNEAPINLDKVEKGNWNLLRFPYYHSSSSSAGTTRTVNADRSITITGTATQTYNFNVKRYTQNWVLPKGTYKISGCPSGGSALSYYLRVQKYENGNLTTLIDDYGDSAEFTLKDDTIMHIIAGVVNGYVIQDSITFRPTITRVKFPACDKTESGTYTLQATVDSSGTITYSWV